MSASPRPRSPLTTYLVGAALVWTAALGALFAWQATNTRQFTRELVLRDARTVFNKDQAFRLWATAHGGVYVPIDEHTPPNPGLAHMRERDITTPSGRRLTLMNPAYMLRQLNADFHTLLGLDSHITSLKPLHPGNAPDEWERRALLGFERGVQEVEEITAKNGEPYLRLMRPMIAQRGCLACHATQGYKEGDVRGGVSVSVPLTPYLQEERRDSIVTAASYGGIGLLGLVGIGVAGWRLERHARAQRDYEAGLTRAKQDLEAANERLAAEVAERERLAREVAQVLRFTGESILAVDLHGVIMRANPAAEEALGYKTGELVGRRCAAILCDEADDPVQRTLAEGTVQHLSDACFRRRDGTAVQVQMVSTPIRDDARVTGAVISFRDVTAQRRAEQAMARLNRVLKTLSKSNEALVRAESEPQLLHAVCRLIVETGGFAAAWVGFCEQENTVRPVAAAGVAPGLLDGAAGAGTPVGEAIRTGLVQVFGDLRADEGGTPRPQGGDFGAMVVAPLVQNDAPFGILCVYAQEAGVFDANEVALLAELTADLAYGIRMLRTTRDRDAVQLQLEQVLLQTIQAISLTVEKRDPYTAGHQQRVSELAAAIGQRMGLDRERIQGLRLGAIIHDIGKIYVPSEILSRPGKLSAVEFNLIKTHPQVGYEIVAGVDFPWPVTAMILQHHERLNGSGYPQGLSGEAIALEARILAVADVVEAISAHRPYRPALGPELALAEIRNGRGTLFDPVVVDACVALFTEDEFRWRS